MDPALARAVSGTVTAVSIDDLIGNFQAQPALPLRRRTQLANMPHALLQY